ncbi:MAG: hypothetical protein KF830_02800 [Planctomycetes bacterium]|nr:hypothetical protein [Planctomycetota bacterium]
MHASLLADVRCGAAEAGLNLFGMVDAERFDASQTKERRIRAMAPGCGTVLVLGSGGRQLWQRFARSWIVLSRDCAAELDRYAIEQVGGVEARLQAASLPARAVAPAGGTRLPFEQLGEAAGFGTISPVTGHLLHPEFGPWVRVRGVVLVDGRPFGPVADASIADRFQPCCGCSRPCVAACPAGVHDGLGRQDLARCAAQRHVESCAAHCRSRSACPVGSEHRDGEHEHAHRHAQSLEAMRRGLGIGRFRWLPVRWRPPT